MSERSRLLWRCRRGILEMDILFQRFIDQYYDQLSTADKCTLDQLLDQADPDILAWITGKSEPPSGEFDRIIPLLRDAKSGLE
ncbi:MAG: hypothetical protein A2W28_09330 [Gammaproteobacteria bacterium RBG_16_51_14]|nr:MAG: hypothetical protein A2W28_09330 [Gammaproteobacteria bacterium RBG_16_51_14]